jgi:hypothetical protein
MSSHHTDKQSIISSCPSEEELALFIDGRLKGKKRQEILVHLNNCRNCFEIVCDALNLLEECQEKQPAFYAPVWQRLIDWLFSFKLASAAFATGAVAIAAFICLVVFFNKSSFAPLDKTSFLVKHISPSLYYSFSTDSDYSFSRTMPCKRLWFKTGVLQTDILIAIYNEDKDTALRLLTKIKFYFRDKQWIMKWENIEKKLKKYLELEKIKADIKAVQADNNYIFYQKFGQWTEAARICGLAGKKEFFNHNDIVFLLKESQKKNLPQGVINALQRINILVKRQALKKIPRACADIIEIMG